MEMVKKYIYEVWNDSIPTSRIEKNCNERAITHYNDCNRTRETKFHFLRYDGCDSKLSAKLYLDGIQDDSIAVRFYTASDQCWYWYVRYAVYPAESQPKYERVYKIYTDNVPKPIIIDECNRDAIKMGDSSRKPDKPIAFSYRSFDTEQEAKRYLETSTEYTELAVRFCDSDGIYKYLIKYTVRHY